MYDYLNISGLTGTSNISVPSGTSQKYTISYSSNTKCNSFSGQQVLFQDNSSTNTVDPTGFSASWANGDYATIQGYNLTAEVELVNLINSTIDSASNNRMGFNTAVVTINNPNLASFTTSSITLLLVRSNNTLGGNNQVLVSNATYSSSSWTQVATNQLANQYIINVGDNISNVLQGSYTMYAIVSLTNVNNGTGTTYSINLLSEPGSLDSVFAYPKIIQTKYNNTTGVLLAMINNNYDATTTLEIDNVPIQTLAQNVFPSRVVATQLNIPNTAGKNVFAELALSNGVTNYYTITTTGSTSDPTVVTEYTPSQTFVNL